MHQDAPLHLWSQPIVDLADLQRVLYHELYARWGHIRGTAWVHQPGDVQRWCVEATLNCAGSGPIGINVALDQLSEVRGVLLNAARRQSVYVEILEEGSINKEHRNTLAELRDSGVCIVMDDYGTLERRCTSLHEAHWDVVKLDKLITRGLVQGKPDCVRLAQYALDSGVVVVAEGVEDSTWVDALAHWKVDYVQGYAIAPVRRRRAWRGGERFSAPLSAPLMRQ